MKVLYLSNILATFIFTLGHPVSHFLKDTFASLKAQVSIDSVLKPMMKLK